MGLFGRKKKPAPAEILAEGRAQFESGNRGKAFLTLHKLANDGNPEACYYIARYYLEEKGDERQAKRFFAIAAKGGYSPAAVLLAERFGDKTYLGKAQGAAAAPSGGDTALSEDELLSLLGITDDAVGGTQSIRQEKSAGTKRPASPAAVPAASAGSAPRRSDSEEKEKKGFTTKSFEKQAGPDESGARSGADGGRSGTGKGGDRLCQYREAAERGDKIAQYNCGILYNTGDGAPQDREKALYWFEKSAAQGFVKAQFNCGVMYDNGRGTAVDKKKALYWYEKAAAQGEVKAQFNAGAMYDMGEGTAVNKKMALYWYEKAAEQGHCSAQFNCGIMYSKGRGTGVDMRKALYWYEKAAEQGHTEAQVHCGIMYSKGEGAAMDKKRAMAWYEKAAAQNHCGAQFNLGAMYFNGEGVPRNQAKAKVWFEKAAAQGDEDARQILRKYY